jgi:hypothetical protein
MKQLARIMNEIQKPQLISMEEELVAVADANDARVEAETALDEAERALDITGALEDLHFVADTIKEATPREVALMQIVSNTALAGTDVSGDTIAYEAEATPENRTAKIKAVIKRILDFIKELVAKVMEHAANFISSIFKTIGNIERRYEQAVERFNEAEHKFAAKEKIEVPGFILGGKFVGQAKDVIPALKDYDKAVSAFRKDNSVHVRADAMVFEEIFNGYKGDEESVKSCLTKAVKMIADSATPKNNTLTNKDTVSRLNSRSSVYYSTDSLIGGYAIKYFGILDSDEFSSSEGMDHHTLGNAIASICRVGYTVVQSRDGDDVRQNASNAKIQIDAYDKDQVKQTLAILKDMVAMLKDQGDGLVSDLKTSKEMCSKYVENITKTVGAYAPELPGVEVMANASKRAITHLTQQSTSPYSTLVANTMRLINQSLVVVNRSLDAHEAA